jgi:hypothetical protein
MDGVLTHGLVPHSDGGGVMQDQDLALELPACLGVEQRRHHHHAFADVRALDLKTMATS